MKSFGVGLAISEGAGKRIVENLACRASQAISRLSASIDLSASAQYEHPVGSLGRLEQISGPSRALTINVWRYDCQSLARAPSEVKERILRIGKGRKGSSCQLLQLLTNTARLGRQGHHKTGFG